MKNAFQEALLSRCICLSLQKQECQTLEHLADTASLSFGDPSGSRPTPQPIPLLPSVELLAAALGRPS